MSASKPTSNALDAADNDFAPARIAVIIAIATAAAFISPMTANVFLPALPAVARDLNVTIERVNLAVFNYMIAQGVSPLFLGGSDALGRRSIYLFCFLLYAGANAGLANLPNGDFAGLLVLRFMQATGSASMIAIGVGVVNDVCKPTNRGTLMGIVQAGSTLGPALGPVLGGIFAQAFGWRGIFWFCFILGAAVLVLVLVFLPETIARARTNNKIPLLVRTPWLDLCIKARKAPDIEKASAPPSTSTPEHEKRSRRSARQILKRVLQACASPFHALAMVRQPEILMALLIFALPFASFYSMTVPLSDQFEQRYGLNTLQAGLIFLAPGLGVSGAAICSGRLMDRSFRKVREHFDRSRAIKAQAATTATEETAPEQPRTDEEDTPINASRRGSERDSQITAVAFGSVPATADIKPDSEAQAESKSKSTPTPKISTRNEPEPKPLSKEEMTAYFPLERARLAYYPAWTSLMVAGFLGYGWTLNANVHLSVPIIFTFIVGVACGGQFSILGCILVDYASGRSSQITAVNNLFRCLTGALVSAVVQYLINAVGIGWTQSIFALVTVCAAAMAAGLYRFGPGWRRCRYERRMLERERAREQEKAVSKT